MDAETWLTEEAQAALDALGEPHVEKKRYTVRAIAWAMINGEVLTDGKTSYAEDAVFKRRILSARGKLRRDPGLCARSVWYRGTTGWRFLDEVQAALQACLAAARAWKSATVQRAQVTAWEKAQLLLAERAPEAIVNGLTGLIADTSARGDHRLAAVDRLAQFAFPELAGRIPAGQAGLPVDVNGEQTLHIEFGTVDAALVEAITTESGNRR